MSKSIIERFNKDKIFGLLSSKKVCVAAGIVLLSLIMFGTTGCNSGDVDDIEINTSQEEDDFMKDTVKVGNDGVNAAIAPDEAMPVDNNTVTVAVEDLGRSDPFLPSRELTTVSISQLDKKPNIDLLPPPESLVVDSTAVDVVSTKVSGIMYDKFNPSAILNIGGSDYLVRTGDVINSYKILSIGKENVTVQYGANVYKAGVGELFTGDGINYNTVSNLERKFGGNKVRK